MSDMRIPFEIFADMQKAAERELPQGGDSVDASHFYRAGYRDAARYYREWIEEDGQLEEEE